MAVATKQIWGRLNPSNRFVQVMDDLNPDPHPSMRARGGQDFNPDREGWGGASIQIGPPARHGLSPGQRLNQSRSWERRQDFNPDRAAATPALETSRASSASFWAPHGQYDCLRAWHLANALCPKSSTTFLSRLCDWLCISSSRHSRAKCK